MTRLYHGTNALFDPHDFEIGRESTTVPVGGGAPVPVRNAAAFFTEDREVTQTYGRRIVEATLSPAVSVLEAGDTFDWRLFENGEAFADSLRRRGYRAVRFIEGDRAFITVAVLDLASVAWQG